MLRSSPMFLAILCGMLACKSVPTSQVKHEWGKTLKPGQELNCQEEPAGPYQAYIRQHLDRLATHNPDVFHGPLEAKKFCIVPIEADDIDAGSSWDGSLFINSGVLRAAQNDAQFAAAIAHELAHITMRHGTVEIAEYVAEHPQYRSEFESMEAALKASQAATVALLPKQMADDPNWGRYQELLRSLIQKEWNRARLSQNAAIECTNSARLFVKVPDQELRTKIKPVFASQQSAELSVFEDNYCKAEDTELQAEHKQQSLYSNWRETEADEVGYEFYLKSSYARGEYASFFENVARISGTNTNCERGEKDHPGDCWRAQNIREELAKHAKELGYAGGSAQDVFGTSLVDLKKSYNY